MLLPPAGPAFACPITLPGGAAAGVGALRVVLAQGPFEVAAQPSRLGDRVAAAGGLDAERDREVRVAGADRSGDDDILGALDVFAGRQL